MGWLAIHQQICSRLPSSSKFFSPLQALLCTPPDCQGEWGEEKSWSPQKSTENFHLLLRSPCCAFPADPASAWAVSQLSPQLGLQAVPVVSCSPVGWVVARQGVWTSLSARVLLDQLLAISTGSTELHSCRSRRGLCLGAGRILLNTMSLGVRKMESSDCAWTTWCFVSFGIRKGSLGFPVKEKSPQ